MGTPDGTGAGHPVPYVAIPDSARTAAQDLWTCRANGTRRADTGRSPTALGFPVRAAARLSRVMQCIVTPRAGGRHGDDAPAVEPTAPALPP